MNKRPIIALDAGHGLHTLGKRCMKAIDPNETREWYLNARVADLTQARLSAYDCTVIRVDDTTGAKDIKLSARTKTANAAGADIYISIHHNAGINGGTGGGTVVFYYAGTVRQTQAYKLYNAVTNRTGLVGNRSSKVADNTQKSLYVIRNTHMPAFLIENGFMDSRTDAPIILTQAHAERTAQGIVDFLVAELDLRTAQEGSQQSQTGGSTAAGDTHYYPAYTGPKVTLSAAMTSLGLDADYSHRKLIAKANNITGYVGTAAQNTRMYNLLVAGILIKA